MVDFSKKSAAWLSVGSNTFLTVGKALTGLVTGSVSVLSEALHSAIDLLAALIAAFSVHVSDIPPDEEHQYGHEKVENVSGVIEGLLIFLAAGWIIMESVDKLLHGVELKYTSVGAVVMGISIIFNFFVSRTLKRVALKERSVALEADAAHLSADVITSAGVMCGLAGIYISDRFFSRDMSWLDPVIALVVALFILRAAFQITRKSFLPLMDYSADEKELSTINGIMDEYRMMGVDFHKLRTRRAGGKLHVDLHMGFKPGVSLEDGHNLSHGLKAKIEQEVEGASALIHVEPSSRITTLPESDTRIKCIRDEVLKDNRVVEICGLSVSEYEKELCVKMELLVAPSVTIAESRELIEGIKARLSACPLNIHDIEFIINPAGGWQSAIHEDDKKKITELLGEHESGFAGIHSLQVSSWGGVHYVHLTLAVPPALPVSVAHQIAKHLEEDIKKLFSGEARIDIHIEPCGRDCKACKAMCPEKSFVE